MSNLITPEQMAERFDGVPVSTVMAWNKKHRWPHVRVGKRVRWTEEQYEEIVRQQTVVPEQVKKLPGQTDRSARRSA